jgi:alpha-tubulin suppressor-like RCC1 family protein
MGATGKLYAWGNNVFGQLGNGTMQGVLVPTLIPLPAGVAAAALVPESGSTSAYLIAAPGGRKRPASATSRSRSPGSTRTGSG